MAYSIQNGKMKVLFKKFNRRINLMVVLDHFTQKSFYRFFLPNAIWPKHHLTECHLTETSFYRKVIWPIFFRKWSYDRINLRPWPKKITQKVVWPKIYLTESFYWKWSFDRKVIWPKNHLTESFFRKNLTERSFDRKFSFRKYCHLTDCTYSIRIVCVPNFFVSARRRERKKMFLFTCHIWNMREVLVSCREK
jgi:hypothetical protein